MFAREVCLFMRTVYKTKHREEILNYLKTIPGVHFTAADICRHFKEQGKNIGTSTVYRQIEQLVSEGLVKKYIIDESSSACFEYIDPDGNCCQNSCFHCKCEKCGKLIHMECREIELLQSHFMEHHGFRIDPTRTVFYGVCSDCMKWIRVSAIQTSAQPPEEMS